MERPKKLPHEVFLKTFENSPKLAINLLVTLNDSFILTERNIPPGEGQLHIPGGFLIKGELIKDACERIAFDELGLVLDGGELPFLGLFENLNTDPRGHVVDAIYGIKIRNANEVRSTEETKKVVFFEKIPKNIGFNHGDYLHKLGYETE